VLIKQVPDTKRVTGQAMNEDGTVNRAALPAIFNPEDLNALETALELKDKYGGTVTVITMGLPAAGKVLRDALYRGADDAVLLTDRRCAASDTLATSYILSCAVKKFNYDIVLCGRQAIDGDTAQVGPQCAEKLGIPQISCVEEVLGVSGRSLSARRLTGYGWQEVKCSLPVLLTVTDEANEPRVPRGKRLMKYKNARTAAEVIAEVKAANPAADEAKIKLLAEEKCNALKVKGLLIKQWDLDDISADLKWCGRDGSPTKVHRIQSVVLAAKETKSVEATDDGIRGMVHELITDKTIA
jgi:electron transfer flavoprotein beta subunit